MGGAKTRTPRNRRRRLTQNQFNSPASFGQGSSLPASPRAVVVTAAFLMLVTRGVSGFEGSGGAGVAASTDPAPSFLSSRLFSVKSRVSLSLSSSAPNHSSPAPEEAWDGSSRRDAESVDRIAVTWSDEPLPDGTVTASRSFRRWIVLVDGDEAARSSVARVLTSPPPSSSGSSSPSHRVTSCDGASAVVALLRTAESSGSHLPDTVVVDDGGALPRETSLDLLGQLRADPAWIRIPVLLITARSRLSDRLAGYVAGADAYLPKPFDPRELMAVVESLLARSDRAGGGGRAAADAAVHELQRDVREIRRLLAKGGVPGMGGFAETTGVFLAPDERRVVDRLCRGWTNKEIASDLFLSTRRVEQLLTGIFRKTQTRNRTELVRWTVSTGQVDLQAE